VNDRQTCVGNCQPIKTRVLFSWFSFVTLRKMADASRDGSEATFKFIEEVHNCPAVWDVSSVAYKDTKTNKRKWRSKRTNWVSSKPFYFSAALVFSSSVSPFYVSATALNKSAMLRITLCCDLTRVWCVKEQVCQHEFANLSLPCETRFNQGSFGLAVIRVNTVLNSLNWP